MHIRTLEALIRQLSAETPMEFELQLVNGQLYKVVTQELLQKRINKIWKKIRRSEWIRKNDRW